MSYILDALKKAESERQLGNVPGVHAQAAPVAGGKSLVGWLIVGLLALIALLLVWRTLVPGTPVAPAAAPAFAVATSAASPAPHAEGGMQTPAAVSGAPTPAAGPIVPASPGLATGQPPEQVSRRTAGSGPQQAAVPAAPVSSSLLQPAPAADASRQSVPGVGQAKVVTGAPVVAATVANKAAVPATNKASVPAVAAGAKVAASAAAPTAATAKLPAASPTAEVDADETLPLLAQLPEVIQREVPAIAVKGYMYSRNPADRVLIIGSNFHHEGEDFPNGVRLEKLLPKAAVFSYKGFRYRVAY